MNGYNANSVLKTGLYLLQMAYRLLRSIYLKITVARRPLTAIQPTRPYSNLNVGEETSKLGNVIQEKLNRLVQWYEETTGMDEVRMAQKRVLDAEERFISAQDRRRETNKAVNVIQSKLKDLYAELDNTSRGEERYVALITEEHKLLKQERQIMDEFKRYEREEREHFSALSSAVKESHEKERAQAERTKYWSIIGSILGTVIGILGSSVNNEIKMRELRKLLKESTSIYSKENINFIPEVVAQQEEKLNAIANAMNASLKENHDVILKLNNVISLIDNSIKLEKSKSAETLHVLSQHQLNLEKNFQEMKTVLASKITDNNDQTIYYALNNNSPDQHITAKLIFLSSIMLVFPIVFRYFGIFS